MNEPFLPDGYNAGYAELVYERYRARPEAVAERWRQIFERGAAAGLSPEQLRVAAVAGALVEAYREHGHLAARLDPLGSEPPGHPTLDLGFHGLGAEDVASIPASVLGLEHLGATVADVLDALRTAYCGTIAYELEHIEKPSLRRWLTDQIESGEHRAPLDKEGARALLERLIEVEELERFLHRSYLGQKRFSIEGLDMAVPMLDLAIELAAAAGAREAMLGMAHRGRLNVLAHVVGRPYERILAEFEGAPSRGLTTTLPETGTGDVKYHAGARGTITTRAGAVAITLAPNPSHLEHVNPVVEGMARAAQTDRDHRDRPRNTLSVLPILIHGDAAFAAQGIVAETLNLSRLAGYETGGTLHLILNNQLGFTTPPTEGRSTRYASDLALGFRIPVIHVNADDPEACLAATRMALAYRTHWRDDIVIDLVGYRRYGHNEGDEPSFTQPRMYAQIEEHSTVREQWSRRLVGGGVVGDEEVEAMSDSVNGRLGEAREAVQAADDEGDPRSPDPGPQDVDTSIDMERLARLNDEIHSWPDDFNAHPKLASQMQKRRDRFGEAGLDWAHAEALAFASLLAAGVPIRMTGQDTPRGTFSQRHLVLHDTENDRSFTPLADLESGRAVFELHNSPLSESAVLGFEYGYSVHAGDSLVIWEAQFGDFSNVGQTMIDLFIAAGRAKWGQESELVMLLPHGYEGQGPEHSSARLERFLQLAAEDNIRVANCTTPAQYFHALRRQAMHPSRRPLVLMTPKSLLRHPLAQSRAEELAGGRFHRVLDDPDVEGRRDEVRRLIWCSGKVYYDLISSDYRDEARHVAIARLELLYPFRGGDIAALMDRYPALEEVVWVQEEPANMGAWSYVRPRMSELLPPGLPLTYVGRPEHPSPAEGHARAHEAEQARIVQTAFGQPSRSRRAGAATGVPAG